MVTKRLFAVVLLPTPPVARQVEALRTTLDDPRRHDLPSHLTLVPPIALAMSDEGELRQIVRAAAAASEPFDLALGPATSFAPTTSTLHLGVGGDRNRVHDLRDRFRRAPLDRPDTHPFEPHVTLLQHATAAQVAWGEGLLAGPFPRWPVDRVAVMERQRRVEGSVWVPVVEEPFGGPDVVGRGGVELALRTVSTFESALGVLFDEGSTETGVGGAPAPGSSGVAAWLAVDSGAGPFGIDPARLVVVAEAPGEPGSAVGCAIGRAGPEGAVLQQLVVAAQWRRMGVARHLVAHWCLGAARRGSSVVTAEAPAPTTDVLEALGFSRIGSILLRRTNLDGH